MALKSLAVIITLISLSLPVLAQFPGKGDASDWSDALPYYNRANHYADKARYDEAVEDYKEAIARYPYDPDFYINLGFVYRKLEEYASAERAFRKALSLRDKDWMSWSNLANALLKQNRLSETISAFEKALKCAPPAAQKEAMEKDIADIKKVLASRGESCVEPGGAASKPTDAKKRSNATKTATAGPNVQSHEAAGKVLSRTGKAFIRQAKPVSRSTKSAPNKTIESGWDYVR